MKHETIERLRTQYPPHLEDSKFMTFELRTETWADILAVLEAARALKAAKTALDAARAADDWGDNYEDEPWDTFADAQSALLVLIDLGGTK